MTERISRIKTAVCKSLGTEMSKYIDHPVEEIPTEIVNSTMMKLIKYYQLHVRDFNSPISYTPGNIKISTISSACYVSKSRIFNLDLLNDYLQYGDTNFSEHGFDLTLVEASFGNSLSMEMNLHEDKKVKLTFFQNGRITIAGAQTAEYGLNCAIKLLNVIKKCPDTFYNVDSDDIEIENYRITMINCDYDIGYDVDLDILYAILIEKYSYFITYNNELYQGIKLHYMWHSKNKENNGVCRCTPSCFMKKQSANNGSGFLDNNDCRDVSVSIYSGQPDGKIIITGACDFNQIEDIRTDINRILYSHYHDIKRFVIEE